MQNFNLLSKIKSNTFALWVAILSVVVQSFHSYTAFYNTSSLKGTGWGVAQAILFAVVIDLAILFYTVRNKTKVALGAAFVMVIINSYYYYQHLGLSFQFIFGVFLALTIPCSVYFYSEEIKDEESETNQYHYARIIEDKDAEHDAEIARYQERVKELSVMIDDVYSKSKRDAEAHEQLNNSLNDKLENAEHWRDVYKESSEALTKELYTERSNFKALEQNYEEVIRLRDLALQSERIMRETTERVTAANRDLMKRLKAMPAVGNYPPDDKSLVNVQDDDKFKVNTKDMKITSVTIPDDLPIIE